MDGDGRALFSTPWPCPHHDRDTRRQRTHISREDTTLDRLGLALAYRVDRDDLLRAIRASLAQDAENRAQQAENSAILEHIETLTPREHEVMTYVITGMLNKQIATELDISEETVKIHRGRVMQKLGLVSVAELVRLCEKAGIEPAGTRDMGGPTGQ